MGKNQKDLSPSAKIGLVEHVGYLLGSSVNMNQNLFGTFLLVYYTLVVGVDTGLAASVIAVSKILDGISDLVMGYVVDHTKSKMGKARPWFLRMMLPMIVCSIMAFYVPVTWGTTGQLVYMFVTYNLANTVCYTSIAVPYHALNGFMTMNQKSRSINGGLYMLGTNALSVILVHGFFLKLSGVIGGGDIYTQKGFTGAIIVYMVIFAVTTGLCALLTKERVVDMKQDENNRGRKNKVSTTLVMKALFTNKYWVLVVIAALLVCFLSGSTGSATIYYTQYVLNNVSLQAGLSSLYALSMIPALILGTALLPKFGKRNIMIIGMLIAAVAHFLPLLSTTTAILLVATLGKGIGFGIGGASMGSLIQDAITYGIWKNGFSSIGMGNAAQTFAQKIGTGLGTASLGGLLSLGRFNASINVAQPASAILAINAVFIIIPGIICILVAVCMFFYDLDKKYAEIESDLNEGKFAPGVEAK
jgi:GPH family glycoside/pentoside/hexuronide:cation symporter